jgi:hypothetical protein
VRTELRERKVLRALKGFRAQLDKTEHREAVDKMVLKGFPA